ncbi:MAG: flippase [Ignavibacteriales bacterium]
MTESARIKKNTLYSLLSISSRLVANVIVFWMIARIYGPDIFGTFTFAHTTSTLLILLGDFGFDLLLTTEISKARENATNIFQSIFSLKILFALTAFLLMWIVSFVGNHSPETQFALRIFSFFTLFTTLTNFSLALIKGFEKFSLESIVSLIMNVSLVIIIPVLTYAKVHILIIAAAFVITRLFGLIFSIYFNKKILPQISFKIKFPKEKELHKKVMIFGINLLFTNLFFQLDTILISFLKGNTAVGLYQAVFKLIILPLMIPDIMNFALLPVLTRLFVSDKEKALKLSYLMNKTLFLLSLPITLILFLFASDIITLIYGGKLFADSIPVLKIFAFNIFVRFAFETFALMLTTTDKQIIRMYTVVAATFVNLSLNIILIPQLGITGAAMVSLITIILVYFIYTVYSFKLYLQWFIKKEMILMFTIFLLTGLLISYLKVPMLYGIPIIAIVFGSTGYYYFEVSERSLLFSDFIMIRKRN